MKKLYILVSVLFALNTSAQDNLRFISGTTGAACQVIKYYNGYLYAGTGSTLRMYNTATPVPYQMTFEFRYKSAITDILIRDNFLYVAANYDGMSKWDISVPSKPVKVFDIPCDDGGYPVLDITLAGDTIFLARFKRISAYKDHGESFTKLDDFGFVTGTGRLYGSDAKNGIFAYTVADVFSSQNGVYFYRMSDFSLLSHYVQSFCWPENVIWSENNNVLHVLGGTNTVEGYFYSLDVSNITVPQVVFSDTIQGVALGIAIADPVNAENVHDTIYVATTAGLKPGGPLDTTFIRVYDATNPADIRLINYLPAGLWHFDLAVNYPNCYVASEWYGIKTLNIADFMHPVDDGNTLTGGWNTGGDKYGNYLAVANEGYGFKIFDLSDIKNPELIGSNLDPGFCMKTRFSENGDYIYTLNLTYESFRIYETTTLEKRGTIQFSVGAGKFRVYHDRVFVEQEAGGDFLNIINVTDPADPHIDSTVSLAINDMYTSGGKLYICNNDSILVYDIDNHKFDRIAYIALEPSQDAKKLTVYDDEVFIFVKQKGLVKYKLTYDSVNYSLEEQNVFTLSFGEPTFIAADTFGIYLSYRNNGLLACDRQSLVQKGYFRGELDTKGYTNQYSVQDLFCRDKLVFQVEYFSQTSILTNDNGFSFGIEDKFKENKPVVMVYPNPFSDRATMRLILPEQYYNWDMVIYDQMGQLVKRFNNIRHAFFEIDRGDLKSGIYFYETICSGNTIATGKFIIE